MVDFCYSLYTYFDLSVVAQQNTQMESAIISTEWNLFGRQEWSYLHSIWLV